MHYRTPDLRQPRSIISWYTWPYPSALTLTPTKGKLTEQDSWIAESDAECILVGLALRSPGGEQYPQVEDEEP